VTEFFMATEGREARQGCRGEKQCEAMAVPSAVAGKRMFIKRLTIWRLFQ